jgi:hypothetical protein
VRLRFLALHETEAGEIDAMRLVCPLQSPARMKTRLALALVLAVGCAGEPAQDETSTALTTWSSQGLDSYSFTWRRDCECIDSGRQIRIEVVDGQIASALYVDDETPVSTELQAHLLTIDGVFAEITDALAGNADLVDVAYDPDLGFPASVYVDYSTGVADEELALQISDVRWSTLIGCGGSQ